ncbi:phosphatidate cytidylyltransferase [Monaibacterium marinum]|uniref:Phosphatidate cytidylyltransferase n=1 Tax=Pontivivens marinum TaxID=1690039 RepID=A0A2C9CQW8_9RHOB|nr:phosphatidate cytidylyltransferase [Monaibacterium marinum]SOH93598.1 phosphatidate cytidylyltransferase [Monaibacterium marinum]
MTKSSSKFADLRLRLISALVLAGVALVVFLFGGLWSAVLLAIGTGAMVWEWREMVVGQGQGLRPPGILMIAVAAIAVIVSDQFNPITGMAVLVVGTLISAAWERERLRFTVTGALYIGVAMICIEALRADSRFGFLAVLWLVLVVVAVDVGGYFGGRVFGGPKLWQRVSPKKTWSGLIGSVGCAQFVGFIFALVVGLSYPAEVALMSALVALVAVGGDLVESAAKRFFGVKDSSRLMPGHGGILDRLDGLMAAAILVAVVSFVRGQSIFLW